jgi:hypothetical protein
VSPAVRDLVATLCPFAVQGVADAELDLILDAWLADDMASDSFRHIHSFNESNDNASNHL